MPTTLPDLGASVMLQLKTSSAIAAFTTRIYLEFPKGPNKLIIPDANGNFLNFIMVESGRGGPGEVGLGLQDERVDIKCYGTNRKTSYDIWRTVDWFLLNHDRSLDTSFVKANCRVLVPSREGGPLRLVDRDLGNAPFTMAPYRFVYSGVPTA